MAVLTPREYQNYATDWLDGVARGFLTDHPGLGKTLESGNALVKDLPGFVAAPSHLLGQWATFFEEQYEGKLKIGLATGTRKQRDAALDQKADIFIVNYEMLHSYALPNGIKRHIFDESHHLRNRSANKSKAAAKFVARNPHSHVYMLSASPMWKALDDIWMQLHILHPKIFTSHKQFVDMFFNVIATPYGMKILNVKKEMREELDDIIAPIRLGRTYADVGRFLPEIIENVVTLEFSKEQKEFYRKIRDTFKVQYETEEGRKTMLFNGAGVMHSLRQITMGAGKVEAVKQLVEDANKPAIVGTWYRDHAQIIHKALPNSVCITGEMEGKERQKLALWAQKHHKNIVATEDSIKEGVNLSEYEHIVMAEEHWPPGANYQFISRAVRDRNDGGTNQRPVLVNYVLVKNSVDMYIHNIAKRRQASIKDVIEESLV